MFGSFLLFLKIFWGISWWSPGWILIGLIARDVCLSLSLFLVSCFIAAVHFSSFHSLCTPPPCLSVILTFTLCLSVPVSPSPPLYFCFHHASVFLPRWVLIAPIFSVSLLLFFSCRSPSPTLSHPLFPRLVHIRQVKTVAFKRTQHIPFFFNHCVINMVQSLSKSILRSVRDDTLHSYHTTE